jgi:hypothetical protein
MMMQPLDIEPHGLAAVVQHLRGRGLKVRAQEALAFAAAFALSLALSVAVVELIWALLESPR